MDKKRAPRKRKSPKAGAPNVRPPKGSSNGSTKKAGSSNAKGFPISQMILGVSLVAVVGVVAAIALGAVSVDDIKDSPVWIKAKALLDQTLGSKEGPDSPLDVKEEPPIVPTDDKDIKEEFGGDVKREDTPVTVEESEEEAEVPAQEIEEEVPVQESEEEAEVPAQDIEEEEEVSVEESEEEAEVPVQEIEEEVPVQESEEEAEVPVKEIEEEEEVPVQETEDKAEVSVQEIEEEVTVQEEEEEAEGDVEEILEEPVVEKPAKDETEAPLEDASDEQQAVDDGILKEKTDGDLQEEDEDDAEATDESADDEIGAPEVQLEQDEATSEELVEEPMEDTVIDQAEEDEVNAEPTEEPTDEEVAAPEVQSQHDEATTEEQAEEAVEDTIAEKLEVNDDSERTDEIGDDEVADPEMQLEQEEPSSEELVEEVVKGTLIEQAEDEDDDEETEVLTDEENPALEVQPEQGEATSEELEEETVEDTLIEQAKEDKDHVEPIDGDFQGGDEDDAEATDESVDEAIAAPEVQPEQSKATGEELVVETVEEIPAQIAEEDEELGDEEIAAPDEATNERLVNAVAEDTPTEQAEEDEDDVKPTEEVDDEEIAAPDLQSEQEKPNHDELFEETLAEEAVTDEDDGEPTEEIVAPVMQPEQEGPISEELVDEVVEDTIVEQVVEDKHAVEPTEEIGDQEITAPEVLPEQDEAVSEDLAEEAVEETGDVSYKDVEVEDKKVVPNKEEEIEESENAPVEEEEAAENEDVPTSEEEVADELYEESREAESKGILREETEQSEYEPVGEQSEPAEDPVSGESDVAVESDAADQIDVDVEQTDPGAGESEAIDGPTEDEDDNILVEESETKSGEVDSNESDSESPKEESEVEMPKEEEEKLKDPMMNSEDEKIRDKIMAAEELLQKKQTELGLRKFEALLRTHPTSPRVRYGRAQALDQLAEEQRSNELLQSCVTAYGEVKHADNCPDELKKAALRRQADRMSFQGKSVLAAGVLRSLSEEFPDDVMIQKELGVQHLIMGQDERAKPYFQRILQINPNDGFAKVHLGFILKREGNFEEAITNLEEGIASNEEGTSEGKYFFHLGDAYQRTGRPAESYRVYEIAAQRGLFRSAMQRSLYNVDTLHGQPWWTPKEAGIESAVKKLEDNWKVIQEEALALMNKETLLFEPEDESLRHTGDWKQYMLYMRGRKDESGCAGAPKTCKIIESIPESAGCKRGQVKFSVMHPGTHVWPHTGPTNCRLRSHLGLVIPGGSRIRVVNETRMWEEGKVFIFDDSFEHEVWQEAESFRLVLIADFWHPGLTERQKKYLSPI